MQDGSGGCGGVGAILTLVLGMLSALPGLTDCAPGDTLFTVIPTLVMTSGRGMDCGTNIIKETIHGTL